MAMPSSSGRSRIRRIEPSPRSIGRLHGPLIGRQRRRLQDRRHLGCRGRVAGAQTGIGRQVQDQPDGDRQEAQLLHHFQDARSVGPRHDEEDVELIAILRIARHRIQRCRDGASRRPTARSVPAHHRRSRSTDKALPHRCPARARAAARPRCCRPRRPAAGIARRRSCEPAGQDELGALDDDDRRRRATRPRGRALRGKGRSSPRRKASAPTDKPPSRRTIGPSSPPRSAARRRG